MHPLDDRKEVHSPKGVENASESIGSIQSMIFQRYQVYYLFYYLFHHF